MIQRFPTWDVHRALLLRTPRSSTLRGHSTPSIERQKWPIGPYFFRSVIPIGLLHFQPQSPRIRTTQHCVSSYNRHMCNWSYDHGYTFALATSTQQVSDCKITSAIGRRTRRLFP